MKLMLTSYGLSHLTCTADDAEETESFHGRPPLSMSQFGGMLVPEYSVLLLCDHVVMERQSFEMIVAEQDWTYYQYKETLQVLQSEGFLQLEDFRGVVESKERLLQDVLDRDLANVEQWIEPLKESESIWKAFVENCHDDERGRLLDAMRWDKLTYVLFMELQERMNDDDRVLTQALRYSTKRRKANYRSAIKHELTKYLSQINANLFLSHTFGCGISDWRDHEPFYREKWLSIGRESMPDHENATEVKKLFELSFPELEIRDPSTLIRILKDKRIAELRELIESAQRGEVTFDAKFAHRTLTEVLAIERNVRRIRNFISYATLPIGFIPLAGTPLQKLLEETVATPVEKAKKRKLGWYYLLSEVAGSSPRA